MLKRPSNIPTPASSSAPSSAGPAGDGATDSPSHRPPRIEPGSVFAKVLAAAWSGQSGVVLSPPGAGKSAMVVELAWWLAAEAKLDVAVAAPTRAQARMLTARMEHRKVPPRAEAMTIASLASRHTARYDLALVDEAGQATWAALSGAIGDVPQAILVGDPGQLPPVVTVPVDIFARGRVRPYSPAIEVMARRPDTFELHLPTTLRLGPLATELIAPFYDFAFASAAPQRSVRGWPEVQVRQATPETAVSTAVAAVRDALEGALCSPEGERPARPEDVAVVVSRNSEVAAISAAVGRFASVVTSGADLLASAVTVGTADALQGSEWPIVVALDPLLGGGSDHAVTPGRTCVMLSRQTHALVWVASPDWPAHLADRPDDDPMIVCRERLERLRERPQMPPSMTA